MFGRSAPGCPVDSEKKEWIERRFHWLTDQFGYDALLNVEVILPAPEYFPDSYDSAPKSVLRLLRRVCRYMDIDRDRIILKTYKHDEVARLARREKAAARDTSHDYVWLEESLLESAPVLIANMAFELARIRLLRKGSVSNDEIDLEGLAGLFTVFLGMGILAANVNFFEADWRIGDDASWSTGRYGAMTIDMYGYSLAFFAWHRRETQPNWTCHLRSDVRDVCTAGLHYLETTGNSAFQPLGYQSPQRN